MSPALEVGLAAFSVMSTVLCSMCLYMVADLKADIREIREALGIGGRLKVKGGVYVR